VRQIFEAVTPHFELLAECWALVRAAKGNDDLLLLIDIAAANTDTAAANGRKDPDAFIYVFVRQDVIANGGSIRLPTRATPVASVGTIPPDVLRHVANPPGTLPGFTHAFWVIAFNVPVPGTAGTCGSIRLNVNLTVNLTKADHWTPLRPSTLARLKKDLN
jgi:hypothetical protein